MKLASRPSGLNSALHIRMYRAYQTMFSSIVSSLHQYQTLYSSGAVDCYIIPLYVLIHFEIGHSILELKNASTALHHTKHVRKV